MFCNITVNVYLIILEISLNYEIYLRKDNLKILAIFVLPPFANPNVFATPGTHVMAFTAVFFAFQETFLCLPTRTSDEWKVLYVNACKNLLTLGGDLPLLKRETLLEMVC